MSTYVDGFSMRCVSDVTRGDFMRMCKEITARLVDPSSGIKILPQAISEGGIIYQQQHVTTTTTTPPTREYKCMRFNAHNQEFTWPTIDCNTVETDWTDSTTLLYPAGLRIQTFLKAFYDSKPWTIRELKIVKAVLEDVCRMKVTRLPAAKKLLGR